MLKKPGLLLIQLGSPREPTPAAVKEFLIEFLTDSRVIDMPYLPRQLLVRGIIAPSRCRSGAAAYKKIWTAEGSPLVVNTLEFANKVKKELSSRFDVRLAFRYGSPNIASQINDWDINELFVVPLYPQYALSSTQSAIDAVHAALNGRGIKLNILMDFFNEAEFIHSQSQLIRRVADEFMPDHYLLSFHGLPVNQVQRLHPTRCLIKPGCCEKVGDRNRWCYRAQCMATARALKSALDISAENLTVSFQSRLGRKPWIEPYTDKVLGTLIEDGVRRLLVSCPSFVVDCLETLEEIQIRLRDQFIKMGGADLRLVPALNAEDIWIQDFCQMVTRHNLKWRSE